MLLPPLEGGDKTSTSEAQKVFSWFHLAEFFFSPSCAKGKSSFPPTASFPGFYRAFCFLIYFSTMFGCKELIRIQIRKLQWTGTCFFFSVWAQWGKNLDALFWETFPVMLFMSGKMPFVTTDMSGTWSSVCKTQRWWPRLYAEACYELFQDRDSSQHSGEGDTFFISQQRALGIISLFWQKILA